jgi:hypothetical protein
MKQVAYVGISSIKCDISERFGGICEPISNRVGGYIPMLKVGMWRLKCEVILEAGQ